MEKCCITAHENDTLLTQPQDPERPDIVIRLCPDCSRRHIEVTVDPLDLSVFVTDAG
jgi:hypothetical protein